MSYDPPRVTPRPWKLVPWKGNRNMPDKVSSWCIEADADDPDDQGHTMGEIYGPDDDDGEANAHHIIHCVNNHDALVEALEWYIGRMDKIHTVMQQSIQPPTIPDKVAMDDLHGLTDTPNVVAHEQKYRALLAKVKP